MIPPAPVDDAGALRLTTADVAGALAAGVVGYCVMCQRIGTRWVDLTALELPPVTDRGGILTDQCPLHPECVAELIAYWVSMVAGPGGADGRLDDEDATPDRDLDDETVHDESAARPRATAGSSSRADRLALLGGAYG